MKTSISTDYIRDNLGRVLGSVMRHYFYASNSQQMGPCTYEELKSVGITAETLIWFEGMADWLPAGNLPEMQEILNPPETPITAPLQPMAQMVTQPIPVQQEEQQAATSMDTINNYRFNGMGTPLEDTNQYADYPPQKMFSRIFTFSGRIRRLEFGISVLLYTIVIGILNTALLLSLSEGESVTPLIFAYIPLFWFIFAQGVKRCHDMGLSGLVALVPLVNPFVILIGDSQLGGNQYGPNPKGENFNMM